MLKLLGVLAVLGTFFIAGCGSGDQEDPKAKETVVGAEKAKEQGLAPRTNKPQQSPD